MENQDIESMLREPAKIKWACRRGMLELDILLTKFLDNEFKNLSDADKRLFIELLYLPDPELFSLLMGQVTSPDEQIDRLVQGIRAHARS